MNDLLTREVDLQPGDREWLHLLVGDWQLISDLSFADLVLWVPHRGGHDWIAVAHCRPSTGATVHYDDLVGSRVSRGRRPLIERAWQQRRIFRDRDPQWYDEVPVRQEAIPVVRAGRVLGVVARHTNLSQARTPSRLELTYLQCADDLSRMIAAGNFPIDPPAAAARRGAPRVGDGLIRLDRDGRIGYASPNSLSALHRLGYVGDLVDQDLTELIPPYLDDAEPLDESLNLVLSGRVASRCELDGHGSCLSVRSIPLLAAGARIGGLLLLRDVSELRRRERELLTKDAMIREVHHRVKNNLQTVASLLRLQGRRIGSIEGKAALQEAMRRVATIALVHETLAVGLGESLVFDEVAERTVNLAVELTAGKPTEIRRSGKFGELRTEEATVLALVLTELVSNAIEHGQPETVWLEVQRSGNSLELTVRDDGLGLPEDFSPSSAGLGTEIVQALVGGELRGRISWQSVAPRGTQVQVVVQLRRIERDPVPRPTG